MTVGERQYLDQLRRACVAPNVFRDRLAVDSHREAPSTEISHTATLSR